jgi:hypothetical protein
VRIQEALRIRLLLECSLSRADKLHGLPWKKAKSWRVFDDPLLVYHSFETPKCHGFGFGFGVLTFLLACGTVGRMLFRLLNGNIKLRKGSLILADEISLVIQLLILFTPYIGRRSVHFLVFRGVARARVIMYA